MPNLLHYLERQLSSNIFHPFFLTWKVKHVLWTLSLCNSLPQPQTKRNILWKWEGPLEKYTFLWIFNFSFVLLLMKLRPFYLILRNWFFFNWRRSNCRRSNTSSNFPHFLKIENSSFILQIMLKHLSTELFIPIKYWIYSLELIALGAEWN